ncbi:MAG: replication initiator protein A, partial [Lachnospiraceae bacterium]|nr:replication initiator protein A [Lachnospiraceae bacterium]
MNNFRRYYHVSDKLQEDFIQVPQLLFKLPQYRLMNSDAKLLYGVLRNRIKLSIQNQWIDENNRVYMYYTREQMAEMLSVSLPTIRKAIKQLLDKELLQEERQGLNRPNRLYLLKIQTPLAEEAFSDNLDSDGYSDSEDIYKSGQLNTDSENMQKFTYLDRKDVSPGQKKSF